jgi:hypothetical protein
MEVADVSVQRPRSPVVFLNTQHGNAHTRLASAELLTLAPSRPVVRKSASIPPSWSSLRRFVDGLGFLVVPLVDAHLHLGLGGRWRVDSC